LAVFEAGIDKSVNGQNLKYFYFYPSIKGFYPSTDISEWAEAGI